jgi:hypothetical protein
MVNLNSTQKEILQRMTIIQEYKAIENYECIQGG